MFKYKKKIAIIVQARLNSSRFPNKILKKISNLEVLLFLYKRLSKVKLADDIIFAIPNSKKNKKLKNFLIKRKIKYQCGSEKNVLKRYYEISKKNNVDVIVRITSDCPLADANMINQFIIIFKKYRVDYLSNNLELSFPHGLDIEIFTFKSLSKAFFYAKSSYEKEHVTPFIRKKKSFKKINLILKKNYHHIRVTLDYFEDLIVIRKILKEKIKIINLNNLIKLFKKKPNIFRHNSFASTKSTKIYNTLEKKYICKNFRNINYVNSIF